MDKHLVTDNDIVKKIAKDLGVDELKVKRVLSASVNNIIRLSTKPKCYSIKIPHIGRLLFSTVKLYRDEMLSQKSGNAPFYKSFYIAKKKSEEIYKEEQKLKAEGLMHPFAKSQHRKRKFDNCLSIVGKNNLQQIEEIQNRFALREENYHHEKPE